jgi:quinoprotein glucose dehydrogenase
VKADGTVDSTAGERLLAVDQPFWNHNGGTVVFGPDGMLYLSIGDGGSANDPFGNGQNRETLLGSVVRIDVSKAGESTPYAIPSDNPFVGIEGVRPEIWAWGLRNVWRMSFDPKTGELWAGDVGQGTWEEVDIISKGANFGWNAREGAHDFAKDALATGSTAVDPVIEYARDQGGSITGGEVIRKEGSPLDGVYLYSDYMSGRMWGLRRGSDGAVTFREVLRGSRRPVSSFGRGADGEVYVAAFEAPYQGKGRIYRLIGPSLP